VQSDSGFLLTYEGVGALRGPVLDGGCSPGVSSDIGPDGERHHWWRGHARNWLRPDGNAQWRFNELGTIFAIRNGGGLGERIELKRRSCCRILLFGRSGWGRLAAQRRIELIGANRLRRFRERRRSDVERGSGLGAMPASGRIGTATIPSWDRPILRAVTLAVSLEE
jgi:hypothetical protein